MGEIGAALKEQGKAIIVMMSLAIVAVLAMAVLAYFKQSVDTMGQLGNSSYAGNPNYTIQLTFTAFLVAFGLFGSFASITALIILVKAIIGVVRGVS